MHNKGKNPAHRWYVRAVLTAAGLCAMLVLLGCGGSSTALSVNDLAADKVAMKKPPAPPPDPPAGDPAVVFVVEGRAGTQEIAVVDVDGANQRAVFKGDKKAVRQPYNPCWSPDHQQIAFMYAPAGTVCGLYVINVDGSGLTRLADADPTRMAGATAWSPAPLGDGNYKIAYSSRALGADEPDLWLINTDGTDPVNLTNTAAVDEHSPTWAPDASRLAYVGFEGSIPDGTFESDIYILDLASGVATNISAGSLLSGWLMYGLDWARTQDKLLLQSFYSDDDHSYVIWAVDLSGPLSPTNLTDTGGGASPSWSPDDSKIMFTTSSLWGNLDIMDADGGNRATVAEIWHKDPSWRRSP